MNIKALLFLVGLKFVVADKVLIYGPSILSSVSNEIDAATALGFTVDLVSAATFASMTAANFRPYRAIIFGDASCSGDRNVLEGIPASNNIVWSSVIDGNIIVIGTDEVFHAISGGIELTNKGIKFASDTAGKTGLYMSLSCYYHGTALYTPVPVLSQFGTFTVKGVGCYNDVHIVAVHPSLAGLSDVTLSDWSCSIHEAFDTFPVDFIPLAIANGDGGSGSLSFGDGTYGVPYILARGDFLAPIGCGDGTVNSASGEECDDGNIVGGDGCSPQCLWECGDNVVYFEWEECDDGNRIDFDGCNSHCKIECGDGFLDVLREQCDDANRVNGDGCNEFCQNECSNGVLDSGEECDDGNVINGDGCSFLCLLECGNFILNSPLEECDDGNRINNDGCSSQCRRECGNFIVNSPLEECDDGNQISGDGCSSTCKLECHGSGDSHDSTDHSDSDDDHDCERINKNPVCDYMYLVADTKWPPGHKMVTVFIRNITDPDKDRLKITVVSVFQDEVTHNSEDGDLCPDAKIDKSLELRLERNGRANGRVYTVRIYAEDDRGGSCFGTAKWCIPKNQNQNCTDEGPLYNSTVC